MERKEYTKREKFSCWFYYNKWYLAVGAVVLYVVGSMLWNVLGIGQVRPDYSIAYVGSRRLPDDCVSALENALAAYGEDVNGDGTVKISLSQHITGNENSTENMLYGYAAEVTLMADITEGESYFFLMEDPDWFQESFWTLANPDGSIPAEGDLSGMNKVYPWTGCPILADLELGSYTDTYLDVAQSGQCQELLQHLYLGRRFFWNSSEDQSHNERLWQRLTQGAAN